MTRAEISKKANIANNGQLTKALNHLVISGFARSESFYGNKKRETRYMLSDYYSSFYFRFIKGRAGRDEHFWSHAYDNPARLAWLGLSFERLCKDHISQIKKALGIGAVLSEESSWFVRANESDLLEKGAQIDLLIDRRDHATNIREIKFSRNQYEITKDYQASLREKTEAFRRSTKTKKTLQLTMITTYGIKRNLYSNMISNQVVLNDLFEQKTIKAL